VYAMIFFILLMPLFWGLFEQAGGSMNLFTDRYVDRGGVPTTFFQSINAIYIVLLGPLFALAWQWMARTGIEPSTPAKMGLGIAQMGLAFVVTVWGAENFSNADDAGVLLTPVLFIFIFYLLSTTGELCLSPVGLSAINRLSVKHMASLMMAAFFFGTAGGNFVAGAMGAAIKAAFTDRSYVCLFVGFFVCGFHVAFIGTHLPAYIEDLGHAAVIGGWSLALIGLFNIAGSFASGWVGQNWSKRNALSFLYSARAIVIAIFILTPASPMSILIFSCVMGLLWLSTVPLTMALVAQTQGLTFLSTLTGLIFMGHQTGSFIGAWLGGRIYDIYGDYTPMWWAAVAFGIMAALIHLPIREARRAQAT